MSQKQIFGIGLGIILFSVFFQNCGKVDTARTVNSELPETIEPETETGGGGSDLSALDETSEFFELPVGGPAPVTASCAMAELNMRWPLNGNNGDDWYIRKYFDMTAGAGRSDYNGGGKTSEGYSRIQIAAPYIKFQGASTPVFSAEAGTVVALKVDAVDQILTSFSKCAAPNDEPNFVAIRHENGFQMVYYGLRIGSVNLQIGDAVAKGDFLGQLSSNGCSTLPNVQFEVRNCAGEPVPIMANRAEIFSDPIPNYDIPDRQIIHTAFSILGAIPLKEFYELSTESTKVSDVNNFGMKIFVLNAKKDDFFRCVIKNAGGGVSRTATITMTRDFGVSYWHCTFQMVGLSGAYIFEWKINGQSALERPMTVTKGAGL